MRIGRIEAEAISIPLTRDFGGSTYHVTRRCTVITRVYTDQGLAAELNRRADAAAQLVS